MEASIKIKYFKLENSHVYIVSSVSHSVCTKCDRPFSSTRYGAVRGAIPEKIPIPIPGFIMYPLLWCLFLINHCDFLTMGLTGLPTAALTDLVSLLVLPSILVIFSRSRIALQVFESVFESLCSVETLLYNFCL